MTFVQGCGHSSVWLEVSGEVDQQAGIPSQMAQTFKFYPEIREDLYKDSQQKNELIRSAFLKSDSSAV